MAAVFYLWCVADEQEWYWSENGWSLDQFSALLFPFRVQVELMREQLERESKRKVFVGTEWGYHYYS